MNQLPQWLERLASDAMLAAMAASVFVVLGGLIFLTLLLERWHEGRRQKRSQSLPRFITPAPANLPILTLREAV